METDHDIRAVLCGDAIFANWAARANIPCMASVEELSSFLKTEPAEWLFSVVNPFLLPADVLGQISRGVSTTTTALCRDMPELTRRLGRCWRKRPSMPSRGIVSMTGWIRATWRFSAKCW
ncbi:hypothetical protein ABID25_006697 [Mesorhizobium abyssinicae]